MLQVNYIRENKDKVLEGLAVRNFGNPELVDQVINADTSRRKAQTELDSLSAAANHAAKQIGEFMRAGNKDAADVLKEETTRNKKNIQDLTERLQRLENELYESLIQLPNLPGVLVKAGKTPEENEIVEVVGQDPELAATCQPHWELAAKYDLIDFELGVKISGAGFPVYKGKGARLQRALINFFLDQATTQGYREMQVPHVVNEASGFGTGQLPDKEGQMYHVGVDDLYLIPTAEVPVTNLYRDVILKEEQLPIMNTAYTPCFRREAGSYGAHVRGLNRLHQFDKVELVQITHPDRSYETLEQMRQYVQGLLEKLGLNFRVLRLCGGDMGFTAAMTYDMEVWSGAQQRWLEVSSVSNFETFQSNRLKLRFKGKEGKTQLAHTLNGSALALPRIVAAILENYQSPEGIIVPEVLRSYTGFDIIN